MRMRLMAVQSRFVKNPRNVLRDCLPFVLAFSEKLRVVHGDGIKARLGGTFAFVFK